MRPAASAEVIKAISALFGSERVIDRLEPNQLL